MYASQTKRLCVRGVKSDENRIQHQTSSTETTTSPSNRQSPTPSSSAATSATTSLQSERAPAPVNQRLPSTDSDLAGGSNIAAAPNLYTTNNMTASATSKTAGHENDLHRKSSIPSVSPQCRAQHVSPIGQQTMRLVGESQTNRRQNAAKANAFNFFECNEIELINRLQNETMDRVRLELLLSIRNLITACNKKKSALVSHNDFKKISKLFDDEQQSSSSIKAQLALLFCSIAKGGENNVKILNESSIDEKILNLILRFNDDNLVEACLRCLRAIMSWPKVSRTSILYGKSSENRSSNGTEGDSSNVKDLIDYARGSNSYIVQECISDIFAETCCKTREQHVLLKSGAIPCIAQFLECPSDRVVMSSLEWLASVTLKNFTVSLESITASTPSGVPLLDRLVKLMSKDVYHDIQFLAARCFVQMYRALKPTHMEDDPRIVSHVIPTLVRMVHRDRPPYLRTRAAECIAYTIEDEIRLQDTASICDLLIESLSDMLEAEPNFSFDRTDHQRPTYFMCTRERDQAWRNITCQKQESPIIEAKSRSIEPKKSDSNNNIDAKQYQEMKCSAFLALAALASNLEPIRKKICNTFPIMQHVVRSLNESDTQTLKAVLSCLLSLSRSVQQLRTSFPESNIYNALKNLLNSSSNDVLTLVLAILCNISLDFSPGKHHFLDSATINILCSFTRGSDPNIKLHGMWILMNMVYQLKDQGLKIQILRTLGLDFVLGILETETNEELVIKTLGFLRNLLSQQAHIDPIMYSYGDQITQSLAEVLEKSSSPRVKEQALCVLTNIADGNESKVFIMNHRLIMTQLSRTIRDENGNMQMAAICCITNLAQKEQEGSHERRDKMKKIGIYETLKTLLNTRDPFLSDRVRTAYNQFLIGVDDKYVN